ncbi:hypothetical protein BJ742DRAFT_125272 [Cladochytrium replicatum]|nr:hypothetical protein BJ742DRAFT_125272 [Cladochytrium replicatum]
MGKAYTHRFVWNGHGTHVVVTGSFDDWSQSLVLQKKPDDPYGPFIVEYTFPETTEPGTRIVYKFVIDNEWIHDADLPYGTDEYQNINNFFDVPREGASLSSQKSSDTLNKIKLFSGSKQNLLSPSRTDLSKVSPSRTDLAKGSPQVSRVELSKGSRGTSEATMEVRAASSLGLSGPKFDEVDRPSYAKGSAELSANTLVPPGEQIRDAKSLGKSIDQELQFVGIHTVSAVTLKEHKLKSEKEHGKAKLIDIVPEVRDLIVNRVEIQPAAAQVQNLDSSASKDITQIIEIAHNQGAKNQQAESANSRAVQLPKRTVSMAKGGQTEASLDPTETTPLGRSSGGSASYGTEDHLSDHAKEKPKENWWSKMWTNFRAVCRII